MTLPQANYRYFCLDAFGELHGAEWFYADDDDAAVAHVYAKHPDAKCEVWNEQRLVAKLGFRGSYDPAVQSLRLLDESRRNVTEAARISKPLARSRGEGDAR